MNSDIGTIDSFIPPSLTQKKQRVKKIFARFHATDYCLLLFFTEFTNGNIKNIVTEKDVSDDTEILLITTTYLKASWKYAMINDGGK